MFGAIFASSLGGLIEAYKAKKTAKYFLDEETGVIGKLPLGDILAYVCKTKSLEKQMKYTEIEKGEDGNWYKDDNAKFVYNPNPTKLLITDSAKYILFGLLNDVLDIQVGKFFTKVGTEDKAYYKAVTDGEVAFGEVFGRTYDEATKEWLDGEGKANIPLWNALYSLNVKSFENAQKNILDAIGDVKLGELLLDVTYDAAINSWIYNPTKEKAFADNTLFAKIEGNIFKMTVNELLVDGALNVDAVMDIIFDGIYLGNAMKYAIEAFEAAPVDAREDKTFTEVVKAYGELPVASYLLEEGFYYVQEMDEYYFLVEEEGVYHKKTISVTDERKLEYGEITPESYTKDHLGYVWRKEGKPVSVLYNLIANTDLGTLVNGGTITLIEDLDWLTISDVGLSNSNKVIDLISDTPLCKIANKIDEIVLADLMGYNMSEVHNLDGYADVTGFAGVVMTNASGEYVRKIGDTWYEADATLATRKDGIAKAADYTLKLTSGRV